jgi:hypothetical protein
MAGTIRKVLGKPSTLTSGYREEGTMEESSAGAVLEHRTQILEDSLTLRHGSVASVPEPDAGWWEAA